MLALFQSSTLTIEPHGNIDASDDDHPHIENACPTFKIPRSLHLLLQGKDQSDALEREDGCAEKEWKTKPGAKSWSGTDRWQATQENVIENDDNACPLKQIRHKGDGCQVF